MTPEGFTCRFCNEQKHEDEGCAEHIYQTDVMCDCCLGISPNFIGNVRKYRTSKHRAWHTLFGSQTPEEAIETIRREWSLSKEAQAEFERLTRNVVLLKQRRRR